MRARVVGDQHGAHCSRNRRTNNLSTRGTLCTVAPPHRERHYHTKLYGMRLQQNPSPEPHPHKKLLSNNPTAAAFATGQSPIRIILLLITSSTSSQLVAVLYPHRPTRCLLLLLHLHLLHLLLHALLLSLGPLAARSSTSSAARLAPPPHPPPQRPYHNPHARRVAVRRSSIPPATG